MAEIKGTPENVKTTEIDLFDIFATIWAGRKIVLITMAFFVVTAGGYLFYKSMVTAKEYQSKATILLEMDPAQTRNQIFLQGGTELLMYEQVMDKQAINAELFPVIFSSSPFLEKAAMAKVNDPATGSISVIEYLDKRTKPPQGNLSALSGRISATPGIANTLEIAVTMQDPNVAKQLLDSIPGYIESYFEDIRSVKTQRRLKELERSCTDARNKYKAALDTLTKYNERGNKPVSDLEKEHLNSACRRALEISEALSLQLEKTKILSQEKPQILRVIAPSSESTWVNKPHNEKKLMLIIFLGILAGAGLLYAKNFFANK